MSNIFRSVGVVRVEESWSDTVRYSSNWQTKIQLANGQQDITVRYIVTQMDALSLKRLTYWPALS